MYRVTFYLNAWGVEIKPHLRRSSVAGHFALRKQRDTARAAMATPGDTADGALLYEVYLHAEHEDAGKNDHTASGLVRAWVVLRATKENTKLRCSTPLPLRMSRAGTCQIVRREAGAAGARSRPPACVTRQRHHVAALNSIRGDSDMMYCVW